MGMTLSLCWRDPAHSRGKAVGFFLDAACGPTAAPDQGEGQLLGERTRLGDSERWRAGLATPATQNLSLPRNLPQEGFSTGN